MRGDQLLPSAPPPQPAVLPFGYYALLFKRIAERYIRFVVFRRKLVLNHVQNEIRLMTASFADAVRLMTM